MTDLQPSEDATIDFQFDDEYWKMVHQEQNPDRWIQTSIKVNDTYLYGDEESGVRGLACGVVLQLLESVEAVLSNNNYIVEFEYGPTWLAIESSGNSFVNVVKCTSLGAAENPNKRLEIDVSRPVAKEAWMKAVVDAAEDFYYTVLNERPDFRENGMMERILDRTEYTRKHIDMHEE